MNSDNYLIKAGVSIKCELKPGLYYLSLMSSTGKSYLYRKLSMYKLAGKNVVGIHI